MLVDVHCHLDHKFPDIDQVIERARLAGLKAIITNGLDPATNRISLELAKRFDIVKASLGVYPADAMLNEVSQTERTNFKPFDYDEELRFIEKKKDEIISIGEVGLDFETGTDFDGEKRLFEKCIDLAEKINKPIIVHARKAEKECVDMLESSRIKKVVMHCFHGNFKLVKRAADHFWYFGIPTNVVRSEHFQKLAKEVDLSRLLTETDAPFLSPFKDKRNEPAFVAETIKKIAEIKNMTATEVENNIFFNYEKLFL